MLEETEHIAAEAGHKDVFLQWEERNTMRAILDFYKRQGYCEVEADSDRTEIMLRKSLKGGSEYGED